MAKLEEQVRYDSPRKLGTLPPEVLKEIELAEEQGAPVTLMRPIDPKLEPKTGACAGSAGNYQNDCPECVCAVQYITLTGEPQFYCEPHALKTNDWDIIHYRSRPKRVPELTPAEVALIAEIRSGKGRRRKKSSVPPPEEYDP